MEKEVNTGIPFFEDKKLWTEKKPDFLEQLNIDVFEKKYPAFFKRIVAEIGKDIIISINFNSFSSGSGIYVFTFYSIKNNENYYKKIPLETIRDYEKFFGGSN